MRGPFYILSLFLLFPAIVFAEVNYTRSFVDPAISSSIVVDIAVNNYDEDIDCGGLKFWGVQVIEHETGNRFFGSPRFVSSVILSQTFTLDFPAGDYEEMTFICSDNGEDEAFQFGSIENDLAGDQVIFTITALATETEGGLLDSIASTTLESLATSSISILEEVLLQESTSTLPVLETTLPTVSETVPETETPSENLLGNIVAVLGGSLVWVGKYLKSWLTLFGL